MTAPTNGAQINVGQSVGIQGLATGDAVVRVDVLVDNELYATLTAPDKTKGVTSFPVNVPWTPKSVGTHAVQLKVFGPDDKSTAISDPLIVTAKATAAQATAAAPTAVVQAAPPTTAPTATPVVEASLVVTNDFARVRSGPDTAYQALGQLNKDEKAKVTGRSADSKWWQISYKDSPGWVFGELVTVTDAAKAVAVASAPPLPTAPPRPTVDLKSLPTAPVAAPAATAAPAAPIASTQGGAGILRVNTNPISAGSTVIASWSIPNFRDGSFDKGDGGGLKGPIAQSMNVDVSGVVSNRTITLQWNDTAGASHSDSLAIVVAGGPPPGSLAGARGILRVEANPIGAGGTAYAVWNIPSFSQGTFDKGDGAGFRGPIAQSMRVDIPNVTGARTIVLKWTDSAGIEQVDSLTLTTSGVAAPVVDDCGPGNPDWRGGNPTYAFCVKQDLEWDGPSQWKMPMGTDQQITLKWYVYGISGIRLRVDPIGGVCGPGGTKGLNIPVNGNEGSTNATYVTNARDWPGGGYKFELFITRKDGQEVGYNEKILCML